MIQPGTSSLSSYALALDGRGGGTEQPLDASTGPVLVVLDRDAPETATWIRDRAGLDALVSEALVAPETRPRAVAHDRGLLLVLRGVNLNPGEDPDDMISLRIWVEAGRMIVVRAQRVMALADLRDALVAGRGPGSVPALLLDLVRRLLDRVSPVLSELEDRVDALEEALLEHPDRSHRLRLSEVRSRSISLRRHLGPQREALARVAMEPLEWLDARARMHLRELTDRTTRVVEDLDEVRGRAGVVHDELANRLAEQMNRNTYVLSMVAGIVLPLGLITGLLGINVGGMPGVDSPWAFWIVSGLLVSLAVVQVLVFRRLHWL